jgi:ABC-type transport system substrate-binding protein
VQTDATARRKAFELGQLDILPVDFASYDSWRHDSKRSSQLVSVQELRTDYMGIMCSKPALADRRVREAISLAVNTKAIFEDLQKGRGVLAHGPIPPGVPGYRGDIAPREFSTQKARALLAEAGATNLRLNLWYRDEALNSEMVQAAKSDLEKAGVGIALVPRDQSALRMGVYEGQPDLYLGSWTLDYPDPENAIFPPFQSGNIPRQGNGAHFRNAEVDRLIDNARQEPDAKARIEKYQKAEDAIIRECPWVFLFHRKTYYAVQPDVKGFAPAIMYNADRFIEVGKNNVSREGDAANRESK